MTKIKSSNFYYHTVEGALYVGTTIALISPQTTMPALIKRLGGSDVLIGAWPVVAYLAFFLPQIFSANYSKNLIFLKQAVLKRGLLQRLHILLLSVVVALLAGSFPVTALASIFIIFISNQIMCGLVSPVWMDFFAKTTLPEKRGRLVGLRASSAAVMGLLNGGILTALLAVFVFPYNYAVIICLAFLYQMGSLAAQRKVVENVPSVASAPVRIQDLFMHVRGIIGRNLAFRKFLFASALMVMSFTAVAFFTVAAIKRFSLPESAVGVFTVLTVTGQILSGIVIGWIADMKGTKTALAICGLSLFISISVVLAAASEIWYYFAFPFLGVNIGAEMFMRYNFAVECAEEGSHAMYIGIMNGFLAPFYLLSPLAGLLSSYYGYEAVFSISVVLAFLGIVLLIRMPEPHGRKLAISLK
jgi:MFS family permease